MKIKVKKAKKFNLSVLPEIISDTNKRFANNEARSFRRTTNNWDNKPEFKVVEISNGYISEYQVYTVDKRWFWINYGTEPHEIVPRGNYPLRFQEGYTPKTTPSVIESKGSGERFGETVETYKVVQSIEPRNWIEKIREYAPKRWKNALETELSKRFK